MPSSYITFRSCGSHPASVVLLLLCFCLNSVFFFAVLNPHFVQVSSFAMVHSASASASYLSKVPTYIPPLDLRSEFPAYQPSTSQVSRSMSNRLVYADDPWNSAKMAHGAVERGKMKATTSTASMAVLPRPVGRALDELGLYGIIDLLLPCSVVLDFVQSVNLLSLSLCSL